VNSSFLTRFDSVGAVDSSATSPPLDTSETPARSPKSPRRRLAVAGSLALGAVLLTGCQLPTFGAYKGATSQARSTFHLWQGFFIAGLIVGGFVFLLILWAVFRYRRRSDDMPRQTQYHTVLEIFYTVVPILIVIGLFVATVIVENKVTAVEPNPYTEIHVYAFQWGWEFQYDNGVKVIGQTTDAPTMVVPTAETVRVYLRSYDVLHGFYVPEFNFSRYASPGYWTSFDLNVLHDGVYRGQCTQLCGLFHSLMFFNVRSVSPNAYQSWLQTTGAFQRAHPNSIGQLPASLHANINGTVPSYSGNSGNSGNTGNTGGGLYGD
jgi:cytochrome c oxidase subunit II